MTMFSDKIIIQLILYINCADINSPPPPAALQPILDHDLPSGGFKTTECLRAEDISPMPNPTMEGWGT